MQIMDVLRQAQGGQAIDNLASAFSVEPEQADSVVAVVLPELAQRLERITLSRGGLADLVKALGDPRHRRALVDPGVFTDPAVGADGNAILGHIVGTRDASRAIAARAADASGLDEETVKRMLPFVAAFAMSGIAASLSGQLGERGYGAPGGSSGVNDGGQMAGPGNNGARPGLSRERRPGTAAGSSPHRSAVRRLFAPASRRRTQLLAPAHRRRGATDGARLQWLTLAWRRRLAAGRADALARLVVRSRRRPADTARSQHPRRHLGYDPARRPI
ncbi:MAG TPA: DUF937 domain-containing protein, partial [Hyphomicrobiaceae bacterium]|nr:DUF937 domain-containing protein [Hyphomicrobiaceae bacterium]